MVEKGKTYIGRNFGRTFNLWEIRDDWWYVMDYQSLPTISVYKLCFKKYRHAVKWAWASPKFHYKEIILGKDIPRDKKTIRFVDYKTWPWKRKKDKFKRAHRDVALRKEKRRRTIAYIWGKDGKEHLLITSRKISITDTLLMLDADYVILGLFKINIHPYERKNIARSPRLQRRQITEYIWYPERYRKALDNFRALHQLPNQDARHDPKEIWV